MLVDNIVVSRMIYPAAAGLTLLSWKKDVTRYTGVVVCSNLVIVASGQISCTTLCVIILHVPWQVFRRFCVDMQ